MSSGVVGLCIWLAANSSLLFCADATPEMASIVTAAASVGVYLSRGYIDPGLSMPVMLGVLTGSILGARQLAGTKTRLLRVVFAIVVAVLALEMVYSGISGARNDR